jgi:multiple sugar transport system permease protein
MSLNIYRTAFVFLEGGRAAAMSVVLFLIIGAVTLVQFKLAKSRD